MLGSAASASISNQGRSTSKSSGWPGIVEQDVADLVSQREAAKVLRRL
jgi:hypothetical protein